MCRQIRISLVHVSLEVKHQFSHMMDKLQQQEATLKSSEDKKFQEQEATLKSSEDQMFQQLERIFM